MSDKPDPTAPLRRELVSIYRQTDKIQERQKALNKQDAELWDRAIAIVKTLAMYDKESKKSRLSEAKR